MSLRTYTGPAPTEPAALPAVALGWLLAVATIGLQIAFPLVGDASRATLAAVTVVVFYLASAVHATAYHRWRGFIVVALLVPAIGWGAERIGSTTGIPFGEYEYTDALGPLIGGVPLVVPLAWAMMGYPAYVAASTVLVRARWLLPFVTAWSLMAWDFFLDPMMVELGAWRWTTTSPDLPGIADIPLTNYAGWFGVGFVIGLVLLMIPARRASPAQPATLYLWVYFSSVLGSAVFFDRPGPAIIGGVAMGIVALPLLWRLWVDRG
ncbi:MAG TPA: carotenoid biosynthesis protein [Actinomycetes bacterium]|nr:carotenoid biosynthesis protein [Actinomycetes bacterium]